MGSDVASRGTAIREIGSQDEATAAGCDDEHKEAGGWMHCSRRSKRQFDVHFVDVILGINCGYDLTDSQSDAVFADDDFLLVFIDFLHSSSCLPVSPLSDPRFSFTLPVSIQEFQCM